MPQALTRNPYQEKPMRPSRSKPSKKSPPPPAPQSDAGTPPAPELPLTAEVHDDVILIPPGDVIEDKENARDDSPQEQASIRELAGAMKIAGQLQPILVWKKGAKYAMVFGHRRRAACVLNKTPVRALLLVTEPTPAEIHTYRAFENAFHRPLNPAQDAVQIGYLFEANYGNVNRVAEIMGWTPHRVRDSLYILQLCPFARAQLAAGKINLGQARELVKLKTKAEQENFTRQIVKAAEDGNPTPVDELADWIASEQNPLEGVKWNLAAVFGKKKMACAGCPDNTTTDTNLFGENNEAARCRDASCYESKKAAVGAAFVKITETVKLKVKGREVEAVSASALDVIRPITPSFVDVAAAQGHVKAMIVAPAKQKAAAKAGKTAEPDPAPAAKDKKPTAAQLRSAALEKYTSAFGEWRSKLADTIDFQSGKKTEQRLVLALLGFSALLEDHPYWDTTRDEKPASAALAKLLTTAQKAGAESMPQHIADLVDAVFPDTSQLGDSSFLDGKGPELCLRLAQTLNVDASPPPTLEQFLNPPQEQPAKKANGADGKLAAAGTARKSGTCWKCGCTEASACEGGCAWVNREKTLCSKCVSLTPYSGERVTHQAVGLDPQTLHNACNPEMLLRGIAEEILMIYEAPYICVGRSTSGNGPYQYHLNRVVPADRWREDVEPRRAGFTPGPSQLVKVKGLGDFVMTDNRITVVAPAADIPF